VSDIRGVRVLFMVTILIVAAVLYFAVLAQAKPTNIIFVPPQPPPEFSSQFPNGVTGRCTDTTDPIDASTCSVLQLGGPPERLVCDIPVVLEITQNDPPFSLSAFRCRTTEEGGGNEQSHSPSTSSPIVQGGGQDVESGDSSQTFNTTG
jgi:hypothetical protein